MELKRNKSVVNDLDVGQKEEGAGSVPAPRQWTTSALMQLDK